MVTEKHLSVHEGSSWHQLRALTTKRTLKALGCSLSLGQVLLVIALLLVSSFIPGGSMFLRELWTFPKDTPVDYRAD